MKEQKLNLLAQKLAEFMPEIRRLSVAPRHIDCEVHLAPHQFFCLMIVKKLGTASMKDLSLKMGVSKQQLTRIIDSLEKLMLLVRFNMPQNRRLVYVKLTPQGEQMVKRHQDIAVAQTVDKLKPLSEQDIDMLISIVIQLGTILVKLKPEEDNINNETN